MYRQIKIQKLRLFPIMRQNKEESWPGQWWQLPEPTVGKSFNSLECCNLVKDRRRHSQGDNCWLCYRYIELLVRLRRSSFEQTKVHNVNWFFGTLYHSQYTCSNICIKSKYITLIEIIGQTSIVEANNSCSLLSGLLYPVLYTVR